MDGSRRPNRRGEGSRLRDEIVAGATAVLEDSGNEDAVTLRAVARRVGIAAPSIYGHFPDRDAMLRAVVAEAFSELDAALAAAVSEDPDDQLRALCRAYVGFAGARPNRYRLMFARYRSGEAGELNKPRATTEGLAGGDAFRRLVHAVSTRQARAASEETLQDAVALWVALHGYVSLREAVPAFPWPPEDTMLEDLLSRVR
jgi:AcrR family transcriptional regulator